MTRLLPVLLALTAVHCKKAEDSAPLPQGGTTATTPPATLVTPVGEPLWEIGDVALVTGPSGEGTAVCLLDGPHKWDGERWIPGVAHEGPYATELRDKIDACGLTEKETWESADISSPNGLWLLMMVMPKAGNAPGSSPDFGLGDVIYEDRFPLVVDGDVRRDGIPVDIDNDLTFPTTTELGYVVTGHSHVPVLMRTSLERMPAGASAPGTYQWDITLRDATSIVADSGYDFTLDYTVSDPDAE